MVLIRSAAAALVLLAVAGLPSGFAEDGPSEADFALVGCRVVTVAGDEIPDGTVLVKDGRIAAVGAREAVDVPRGAEVIDGTGGTVTPGFVHPNSRLGLRGSGGGGTSTRDPERTVMDDLNPWLPANRWAAANGFTTLGLVPGTGVIAGRGVAVRSAAGSIEAMVRKEDALLKLDVDSGPAFASTLSSALASARKDLDALAKYAADHTKWEADKKKAETDKKPVPKEPAKPKQSDKTEPYRKVLRGETALLAYVDSAADVQALERALADERVRGEKLRLYAWVWSDAVRSAAQLADLGAVCLVRVGLADWPGTTDRFLPAAHLRRSGCKVALLPVNETRDGLRSFPYHLARTVRDGLPRAETFRAAFLRPAELLGLGDEIGTLEKGRRADLVLWEGDPLDATTSVRAVWIDGERVEETP